MWISWWFYFLLWIHSSTSHSFIKTDIFDRIYKQLDRLIHLESNATKSGSGFNKGHSFITKPNKEAYSKYETSIVLEIATREGGITRLPRNSVPSRCDTLRCSPSDSYSKLDGACNNLWKNRRWGSRLQPLRRILPSVYNDHISEPKIKSINGSYLPNARVVSNAFHQGNRITSRKHNYTLMLMQWGQFLDHDISFTPNVRALRSGEAFNCNSCDSTLFVHPACFPIMIPKNDPYFPAQAHDQKRRCLTFTRSMPGQKNIGKRQQLNQNSGLLDASHVYGSSICSSNALRKFKYGHLKVTNHPYQSYFKPLMPMKQNIFECESHFGMCFHSGDDRSNEQPGLTSLHTLFVREHNYICDQLRIYNPKWSDDTLFQEARRILRAINQQITYNEFIPRILNHQMRSKFGLILQKRNTYFPDYNSSCSADVFNEFSTAAFRFGHTLIAPMINMINQIQRIPKHVRLRHHFNNPDIMQSPKFIDYLVNGLSNQKIEEYDSFIESDLRNRLFEEIKSRNSSFVPHSGLDLAALNIQRGRDHGIPGYVKYRNWCKKENITSFNELRRVFNKTIIRKLKSVYKNVQDIDLFTGGILEESMKGGLVGETFGCIIGLQFKHLRYCDRYWFENPFPYMRFTRAQLREIKKVSLASIVCRNCDQPRNFQKFIMDMPNDQNNYKLKCSSHPNIDLKHWIDQRHKNSSANHRFCDIEGRIMEGGDKDLRISGCTQCSCPDSGGNAICQTININSCSELINEIGLNEVKTEEDCFAQCSNHIETTILNDTRENTVTS
uniref:Peroxidasinlike [Acyrthosiphon pisum] n=1 Tax=Lepeophtheirus salmonis TaxID=72036 RepID=A0A0K2TLR4_LEPSM